MNIALIGGTGYVGSKILAEALRRGHKVTAIVRHPQRLAPRPNLRIKKADVLHRERLARILARHDVIISAFNPKRGTPGPEVYHRHVRGHRAIIAAAKRSGVKRFLAVGGAASLKTPAGIEFLDSSGLPCRVRTIQARHSRHARALLPAQKGTRPRLGVSRAFRDDCARRANGQIPARQGSRPLRREGREPDLAAGLRRRDARRARTPAAPPRALHVGY